MKRVRLLPIVVCAAAALLVFKTVGIATNGGYILNSVAVAEAAGAAAKSEGGAAPLDANGAITIPAEPTMTDTAPTMADPSPTVGGKDAAGGHAAPAAGEEAAAPAGEHGETPAGEVPEPDATQPHVATVPPKDCAVEADPAAAEGAAADGAAAGGAAAHGATAGAEGEHPAVDCLTLTDAVAVKQGTDGNLIPLTSEEGALVTQKALLARLSERRTELDSLQTELDMRAALVDAAEKRLEERAATVAAMEAQIGALVAEKKAMEDEQLKSIINMYETMKPKEAASVFNTLEMEVLLRVARTMNPRKMAPIMAKMDTKRAEELTVRLAAIVPEPTVAQAVPTGQDLSALPQIVGQ